MYRRFEIRDRISAGGKRLRLSEEPKVRFEPLKFPMAKIRTIHLSAAEGWAAFTALLPEDVRAALKWPPPSEDDGIVSKRTRLIGERLIFKQSQREIGDKRHEADIEITSVEQFKLFRNSKKSEEIRVRFVVRFKCLDAGENLEPLLKRVVKPGHLTIWCKPTPPKPKQIKMKIPVENDQTTILEVAQA